VPASESDGKKPEGYRGLLASKVAVVNLGLESFVTDLQACGVEAVQVDWVPPAGGDPKLAALLAKLGV
jgi:FdrA protein